MKDSITARTDTCRLGFVKLFAVIPADKMVTRKRRKLAPDKIVSSPHVLITRCETM